MASNYSDIERMRNLIGESRRDLDGTCAQISPTYEPNTFGICGASYAPNSYEKNKYEVKIEALFMENQKLKTERENLVYQLRTLVNHINTLEAENKKYKVKKERGKVFVDFWVSVKEGAKLLYLDLVKWFNT